LPQQQSIKHAAVFIHYGSNKSAWSLHSAKSIVLFLVCGAGADGQRRGLYAEAVAH